MTIFGSPPFSSALDRPLYEQLYTYMRSAILAGELKGGARMPSTRALADELGVSRNTILGAYGQLLAEGYLESVGGSGTYVARVLPEALLTAGVAPDPVNRRQPPAPKPRAVSPPPQFSQNAQLQLATPQMGDSLLPRGSILGRPFRSGVPALDVFPFDLWTRLVIRQARRLPTTALPYQDPAGYRPLREAIAAHVSVSRRVHCTPDQIMIVSGSQGALDLATRMLVNPGDPVWMEDPGYLGARGALLGAGASIVPVPVDDDGLVVDAGIARAPNARLVYLTPSHQFPLGVTMSLTRRLAILEWARQTGAYILEDDYDSEYRFTGHQLAALQGLDGADRVIYIGTFSKVMFPALRMGYMILPPPLVEAFLTVRRLIDIHNPMLEQAALTDFITEGHFSRHLRRMRTLYAERRAALLEVVRDLPLEINSPEAGLHCVGWLPDGMSDVAVARAAFTHDVDLSPISKFAIETPLRQGLVLSYAGYSVQQIRDGVNRLAATLRSL